MTDASRTVCGFVPGGGDYFTTAPEITTACPLEVSDD